MANGTTLKITFKLYASLSKHLPSEAVDNVVEIEINSRMSVHDVLERYKIPRETVHLVLQYGVYINPVDRDRALFSDGDTLALWPPVAGG